jgi:hypothetical protein
MCFNNNSILDFNQTAFKIYISYVIKYEKLMIYYNFKEKIFQLFPIYEQSTNNK